MRSYIRTCYSPWLSTGKFLLLSHFIFNLFTYFELTLVFYSRRWLISNGMRLAAMCTLEHPEVTTAFRKVVECVVAHGKTLAISALAADGQLKVSPAEVPDFKADAPAELVAAMGALKKLELPHIAQLERDQDDPISVIMAGLTLPRHLQDNAEEQEDFYLKPSVSQLKVPIFAQPRDILNPFRLEKEISLQRSLNAHVSRVAAKKGRPGRAVLCGIGAAHLPRSDGVPVMVATVSQDDATLLKRLEDAKEAVLAQGSSPLRRTYSI